MDFKHSPVMLNEVLSGLNINPDGIYIDCTLGGGGHSEKILEKLNPNGMLIGLDKDQDAIDFTTKKLSTYKNFKSFHTDFKNVDEVFDVLQIDKVDGVLIDLGVSSYQLDTASRGFSFRFSGPLDMRMDKSQNLTAYDVVNTYSYEQLVKIFFEYGEEEFSKSIAKNIVKQREISPIKTTLELSKIIEDVIPKKFVFNRGGADKKVFQAIRIEVNDELDKLYETIIYLAKKLKSGGRIAILTFHSLEDRIVKNAFKELCTDCICPPKTPICICGHKAIGKLVNKKPIIAGAQEQEQNSRSTCAKLRILERI
ncbi:MAG: 16S rRNA (cytosine(1402)-N(4))-methyltransferase RsmH [Clostridia bacterium]|nr:16S rRNA (cytosine(1402)-N(4))-methyltransferase RsmH [Clostridia bacterium]